MLSTLILKIKFVRNLAILDATETSLGIVIFNPKEILGLLDWWSVGCSKIKHGVLQPNHTKTLDLNQHMYILINLLIL